MFEVFQAAITIPIAPRKNVVNTENDGWGNYSYDKSKDIARQLIRDAFSNVAKAFEQLKQQGKVLEFGVSNFRKWQVDLLRSRFPVTVNQVECSLLHLEPFGDGTLDQCQQHNIIPMAWSPMGGGNLFITDDDDERNKRIIAVANILAEKYVTSADVIILSWLMTHPAGILPVVGTSRIERVHAAVAASLLKLEREEWFMLWRASTGREVA